MLQWQLHRPGALRLRCLAAGSLVLCLSRQARGHPASHAAIRPARSESLAVSVGWLPRFFTVIGRHLQNVRDGMAGERK